MSKEDKLQNVTNSILVGKSYAYTVAAHADECIKQAINIEFLTTVLLLGAPAALSASFAHALTCTAFKVASDYIETIEEGINTPKEDGFKLAARGVFGGIKYLIKYSIPGAGHKAGMDLLLKGVEGVTNGLGYYLLPGLEAVVLIEAGTGFIGDKLIKGTEEALKSDAVIGNTMTGVLVTLTGALHGKISQFEPNFATQVVDLFMEGVKPTGDTLEGIKSEL